MLALIIFITGTMGLRAQSLKNTNWKLYIDELHDTITLHIQTDSSYVTQGSNGTVVVRSVWKTVKDSVTMRDVDGQYACPGEAGVYTYAIKEGTLTFFVVGDPCEGRRNSLNGAKWIKLP